MLVDPGSLDLPEVRYADGAQILVEGHSHHQLLVLVSGTVRVTAAGAEISTIDVPGSIFGEVAMLLDGPATATVTAVGECVFLRSDRPEALMRTQPGLAYDIAVTLARRLDLLTRRLADLRNRHPEGTQVSGVVGELLESAFQHDQGPERPAQTPPA